MHDGEVVADAGTVRRLLAEQLPDLAHLPVREVRATGTVNAVFRLGDDLCVRLPRLEDWQADLDRELRWLPELAPHLPLAVPEPVAAGAPGAGHPFRWAVYRWIDGEPYGDATVTDEVRAAEDLAGFVRALRDVDLAGAPRAGRRPLAELDAATREALAAIAATPAPGLTRDAAAARHAWDLALEATPWSGDPVWIHTDLLRPNLLVRDGRLAAVLDFGAVGAGDPAADVVPAWSVFGPAGRAVYRRSLDIDDGTWERARGYALHQAALIVPYYARTNPGFVATAARTVREVVADVAS